MIHKRSFPNIAANLKTNALTIWRCFSTPSTALQFFDVFSVTATRSEMLVIKKMTDDDNIVENDTAECL